MDPADAELPRGQVGEIVARRDSVMQGCSHRPEETETAPRGGSMHTGDGGYVDENGHVVIVGRVEDMIVTGGDNVSSVEVDKTIALHPAVAARAVISVPDDA